MNRIHSTAARLLGAAVLAALLLACSSGDDADDAGASTTEATSTVPTGEGTDAPDAGPATPVVTREGRWFVDDEGRVVQIRGVNEVYKSEPFYPAADDFGPDDVAFLAEHGFTTVRLGVDMLGLQPAPGEVSEEYLDGIATSVTDIVDGGLDVVLDFHQDGFSPKYNGNGWPDWLAIDDGLENPEDAVFPLYYIQNPAMQRAWESFWDNREGPDGEGLQDLFALGVSAVAERFADEPAVLGYELVNEPFPGADWDPCASTEGCADLEQERIVPFVEAMTDVIRAAGAEQAVWVEPFVTFNFGLGPTSLAGADTEQLLAVHSYALDVAGEDGVVDFSVQASERDDKPVLVTEFGASVDPELLTRLTDGFDRGMLSWMFWAYNENIMSDRDGDASLDRVNDLDGFKALVRPYPRALTGVPEGWSFDAEARTFELTYGTAGPDGEAYPADLESVVFVPELIYDTGYAVEVSGGTVTSDPCAQDLTILTDDDAEAVTVTVTPSADAC